MRHCPIKADASERMRRIRRTNTGPELLLQRALRARWVRFSRHRTIHGCRPDLVLYHSQLVIFVDGDFWHGRILVERGPIALNRSIRSASRAFWIRKIKRNVERDRTQTNMLRRHGWSVVRIWERDLNKNMEACVKIIERRLRTREARPQDAP